MSRADPRYLEAWKKSAGPTPGPSNGPSASAPSYSGTATNTKTSASLAAAKNGAKEPHANKTSLNVRLDTPGGVTYSPSELSSHNIVKRTFIPFQLGEGSTQRSEDAPAAVVRGAILPWSKDTGDREFDFGPDIVSEIQDHGLLPPPESEARRYALSIDLSALKGNPEGGMAAVEKLQAMGESVNQGVESRSDARSQLTAASTRSNETMATLAASRPDSSLPDWYKYTTSKVNVAPFIPPSSFTGRAIDQKRPWDAMRWHGHRAFERPGKRDEIRGIAAFEDINGPGRLPVEASSAKSVKSASDNGSDTATIKSSSSRSLSVADLFVVDPRRLSPLRMVRRVDPGQVLLLCNGSYMSASEVAAKRAAKAARDAGLSTKDASDANIKATQELLQKLSLSSEPRGGIGVLFCPNDDPLSQDAEALRTMDSRFEANICKRLEAAPDLIGVNSARRAQLRAVLAALELASWEEEGFDKIVIGVEQHWIVRGITTDIWRWRHTGWKLTEHSSQGGPGENVPDRDLWELLDEAVRKYEAIDCNVRFWHVSSRDASLAKALAEAGALKDVPQRLGIVRWRKKEAPVVAEARERKAKANARVKAKALDDAMHGRKTS
jgi:hypothetical protein